MDKDTLPTIKIRPFILKDLAISLLPNVPTITTSIKKGLENSAFAAVAATRISCSSKFEANSKLSG
jgi:hypothetical protein